MKQLVTCLTALLGIATGSHAHATSWGDFDQNTSGLTVVIDSFWEVLNRVTVTCPLDGFLVVTASTTLSTTVRFPEKSIYVDYSITVNSRVPFGKHTYSVVQRIDDWADTPITMQRVVACSANQTKTLRFVANKDYDFGGASAIKPRLVVLFFDKRI
jgi:hypothetical protein